MHVYLLICSIIGRENFCFNATLNALLISFLEGLGFEKTPVFVPVSEDVQPRDVVTGAYNMMRPLSTGTQTIFEISFLRSPSNFYAHLPHGYLDMAAPAEKVISGQSL